MYGIKCEGRVISKCFGDNTGCVRYLRNSQSRSESRFSCSLQWNASASRKPRYFPSGDACRCLFSKSSHLQTKEGEEVKARIMVLSAHFITFKKHRGLSGSIHCEDKEDFESR
ncbi:unnamed protein product [Hymenolepis diminuta]|uniref:Uncharacterized protein n=1 Tax=Hymenolepis diminuta TaxID=6216 RepID=A0A564XX58_HYMDI|nr:unnamed protein product [Hymenolepis diminuta]